MVAAQPLTGDIFPVLITGLVKTGELLTNLKNAPREMRTFSTQIGVLNGVLLQFEEALETRRPNTSKAKRSSERETGQELLGMIKNTIDDMQLHERLASMGTKDDTLLQKWKVCLRWIVQKASLVAALDTIRILSSMASLFLSSIIVKNLVAQIEQLQRTSVQVPTSMSLKL